MSALLTRSPASISPACDLACHLASEALGAAAVTGACAGTGYIAGSLFTIIDPVGGALFGATFALTEAVTGRIMDALGRNRNDIACKIAKFAIPMILSTVAAIAVVAAAGFPITLGGAAALIGCMFVTAIAVGGIIGTCVLVASCWVSSSLRENTSGDFRDLAGLQTTRTAPHQP